MITLLENNVKCFCYDIPTFNPPGSGGFRLFYSPEVSQCAEVGLSRGTWFDVRNGGEMEQCRRRARHSCHECAEKRISKRPSCSKSIKDEIFIEKYFTRDRN